MVRIEGARPRARGERGFTLIELMIVVAVIAVLAIVVVPTFFKETRKVKSDTEVAPMFAELTVRQEQYKVENGTYLDVAECPVVTSPTGVAATTCAGNTDWIDLRINPPQNTLRCKYQVVTGTGTGTDNPNGFSWLSPPTSWYYVLATCDGDGNTGTNATFFTASSDARLQKLNEGN